jgi:nicotinamide phosphoribosyltransferase
MKFEIKPAPATLMCDFYKICHRQGYPDKTERVYATWTPRSNKHYPSVDEVVWVGAQRFIIKYLMNYFHDNFFQRKLDDVVAEYERYVRYCLGDQNPYSEHIKELHSIGYLPLEIKALPEGTRVPFRVPTMSIVNTNSKFFWLTNYIETLASAELWPAATCATIAGRYREILNDWSEATVGDTDFVQFQGHDFSMRGLEGFEAAGLLGLGHLTRFVGTDSIPAIWDAEQYYGANVETELVGCSVNATEHSVMCAGGSDFLDEFSTYKRLINEVYPTGILSIVSDTWDLWKCLSDIIAPLKDDIMKRDGKVVIRPDSGDPADILCGRNDRIEIPDDVEGEVFNAWIWDVLRENVQDDTPHGEMGPDEWTEKFVHKGKSFTATVDNLEWNRYDKQYYFLDMYGDPNIEITWQEEDPADKGVVELLWDIFGGTISDKGFKVLDSHIGAIYGDSITPEIAEDICKRLAEKGFASINVVFGIGSYTYQYNTRDTFGWAMKSTAVVIDGVEKPIFKDPVTDDGTKKSNTGAVAVQKTPGGLIAVDGLSINHVENDLMELVFRNGELLKFTTLAEIRERLQD